MGDLDVFALPAGIILVVGIVMMMDWYGRRKDKQNKQQRPPS